MIVITVFIISITLIAICFNMPALVLYGVLTLIPTTIIKQKYMRCPRCNKSLPPDILLVNMAHCLFCGAELDLDEAIEMNE